VLHRISDNWEAKLSLTHIAYTRQGTNVLPNDLNLATQTFGLFARRNYQRYNNWILNQDFLGNYKIGSIDNQSAFGLTLTDEYNRAAFTNSAAFGVQRFNIANPQMDSVVVPTYDSYIPVSGTGSWTNNRRSTYYFQQQATIIPDRLILVGGVTSASLQINDVPAIATRSAAGGTRVVNYDEWLHRYGVVVNLTKDIALYALNSTTFSPQGNSNTRDINGVLLPAQNGKGTEFGAKTALMNGKLSLTVSYFDMDLTNVGVLSGVISPVTGITYFTPTGVQKQKGWDGALTFSPIPEWQIIVTGYSGTVKDQNGAIVNNTYKNLYSFFTRYDFRNGGLRGFSIGGGAARTGGNIFTSVGNYSAADGTRPASITLEAAWNASMFVGYKYNKNWDFRLNVINVTDKMYVASCAGITSCFYGDRRRVTASVSYKW
jgi:iron complex outermembrane receptor protein